MRTIFLFFCIGLFSMAASAQIQVPQPSPSAKIEQVVGLTDVTIEYSRPAKRDRELFGNLVPYNKIWRTGANANTTITFSTKITISGEELEKGTYAIYTVPGETEWEVIFYQDTNNWGTPENWDEEKVVLRTSAKVEETPVPVENFTILIDNIRSDAAALKFMWGSTMAGFDFNMPTDEIAMGSIERVMQGPTAGDYFAAATYYHDEGKDLDKAYEWIQKAVEMGNPDAYWVLRRKSLIEADLGRKEDAIATARKSLAAAEKAGNDDYIKLNMDSLKEWGAN